MRRKYEINALPIIAIPEVLDLVFSWLNHNEILCFKLLNYASYQQAMSYLLAYANEKLTCDLLEQAATQKMAFPLSGQSLMKAVLKPDVFIPFRTYGLYAIAASNTMDLQVENEVINSITTKILNFESKNNRPYITDLRFIVDLLTQEQIHFVKKTLSQLSPIDDYATEDFDDWNNMKVKPKDLFPFFDSRVESFRQTLISKAVEGNLEEIIALLEQIRPGFNKDEIDVDVAELLKKANESEHTLESLSALLLLTHLAPDLDDNELSIFFLSLIKHTSNLSDDKDDSIQLLIRNSVEYLNIIHVPLLINLYNKLTTRMECLSFEQLDECLLVSIARIIKCELLVPYLKGITTENTGKRSLLNLIILGKADYRISKTERQQFTDYIYSRLDSQSDDDWLAHILIFNFIPLLNEEQTNKVMNTLKSLEYYAASDFTGKFWWFVKDPLKVIHSHFGSSMFQEKVVSLLNQLPSDRFYQSLDRLMKLAPFLKNSEATLDLRPLIDSIKDRPYRILEVLECLWPYRDMRITLDLEACFKEMLADDDWREAAIKTFIALAKQSQKSEFEFLIHMANSTDIWDQVSALEICANLPLDEAEINQILHNIFTLLEVESNELRKLTLRALKILMPKLKAEQVSEVLQCLEKVSVFTAEGGDEPEDETIFISIFIQTLSTLFDSHQSLDVKNSLAIADLALKTLFWPKKYNSLEALGCHFLLLSKLSTKLNATQMEGIFKAIIQYYDNGINSLKKEEHELYEPSVQLGVVNLLACWIMTKKITPEQVISHSGLMKNDMLQHFINVYTKVAYNNNRLFKQPYEKNGFKILEFTDGSKNEENCPDILYEWNPKPK